MIAALVAFLMPLAFVPYWAGAANSPRWALASVSLYFTPWLALPFLAFCAYRLGLDNFAHWAILCGALGWGIRTHDPRSAVFCFCAGIGFNSALAIGQWFGYSGVPALNSPAGLFVNKNTLGEAALLGAAAAAVLLPKKSAIVAALICSPAIILTQSRAVWIAALAGLLCLCSLRWRLALVCCCLAGLLGVYLAGFQFDVDTLGQRIMLWRWAVERFTWLGAGDFDWSTVAHREPNAHNDFLQMVYQFGIMALVPLGVLGFAASASRAAPFFAAAAVIATFAFPLENPASAWFIAFISGHFLVAAFAEGGVPSFTWLGASKLQRSPAST